MGLVGTLGIVIAANQASAVRLRRMPIIITVSGEFWAQMSIVVVKVVKIHPYSPAFPCADGTETLRL